MKTAVKAMIPYTPVDSTSSRGLQTNYLAPIAWLKKGWHVMRRAPVLSLGIGASVAAVATAGQTLSNVVPALTLPSVAVLLLLTPFALAALFSVACQAQAGRRPTVRQMVSDIRGNALMLAAFGVLLGLLFAAGIRVTALVFALSVGPTVPAELLQSPLVGPSAPSLVLIAGAVMVGFAALAITVFGLPIVHGDRADVVTAVVRGIALVRNSYKPMALWATLVFAVAGFAVWLSPIVLVFALPILGFANWYGFERAAVLEAGTWRA